MNTGNLCLRGRSLLDPMLQRTTGGIPAGAPEATVVALRVEGRGLGLRLTGYGLVGAQDLRVWVQGVEHAS